MKNAVNEPSSRKEFDVSKRQETIENFKALKFEAQWWRACLACTRPWI
jgi:hypothetical protein